jgi:hypothetical protein
MAGRLKSAMEREVVRNIVTGEYGVVMEDGRIEITSSFRLRPREVRTEDWVTFAAGSDASK